MAEIDAVLPNQALIDACNTTMKKKRLNIALDSPIDERPVVLSDPSACHTLSTRRYRHGEITGKTKVLVNSIVA